MRFARFCVLLLGFAFLYGPILILAAMSFNASKLVTVWGGFSTKWYVALLDDAAMLNAAKISLSVAALSAAIATLLGLSRRWRWRALAVFARAGCSLARYTRPSCCRRSCWASPC